MSENQISQIIGASGASGTLVGTVTDTAPSVISSAAGLFVILVGLGITMWIARKILRGLNKGKVNV